jgi:predicted tellurium resistance membrane protein TerC
MSTEPVPQSHPNSSPNGPGSRSAHRESELLAVLYFGSGEVAALLQVIMIDLDLAGDNAIVIGLAAAGLPLQQRTKAVLVGIIAATVLRIAFAAATTQLLQVVGLVLAGAFSFW